MIPILGSLLHKNKKAGNEIMNTGWIGDLPRDNPLAALDVIQQKLAAIVTVDMPIESWRLKSLLIIDGRCREYALALEQQYISIQKLRPELDARMWDSIYAWYRYLARGYQAFIDYQTAHPDQPGFQHNYFPLVVARALHAQANIARWRYMRYQDMPDGGWLALHRLFALAEREGFAGKPLKLYESSPEITVSERYTEALMLDTLNRTNMSKSQIQMISHWLRNWLKAVNVAREFDDRRFLFFTDMQEDRAARRIRNFTPTPSCRYWETDRITLRIDRARIALTQGKSLTEASLSGNAKPAECIELLNQLYAEWSRTDYQRQRRHEDRHNVMSSATVAGGIANVWQQIKDVAQNASRRGLAYQPVDDQSFEERLASHSISLTRSGPAILYAGAAYERWIISDKSKSGMGAVVDAEMAGRAKLGRLVALVTEDSQEQVAVGVIRSIKQRANGQCHIGIEIVTRDAVDVLLTDRSARSRPQVSGDVFLDSTLTNPGVTVLQGILIPANEACGVGRSMLLPNAEFNSSGMYEATRGMNRQPIKFGQALEQNDDWIRVLVAESSGN